MYNNYNNNPHSNRYYQQGNRSNNNKSFNQQIPWYQNPYPYQQHLHREPQTPDYYQDYNYQQQNFESGWFTPPTPTETWQPRSYSNVGKSNNRQQYQRRQFQQGKRSYDEVSKIPATTSRSGETSPAPKRHLPKQNSFEFPKPAANQKLNLSPQKQQQLKPQQSKKKGNDESPAKMIQNFKDKEWKELFAHTLTLLANCKAGDEVKILLNNLQPTRSAWKSVKDQIFNDLQKLMTPMGVKNLLVFGSTLTGLDFSGSDLDYHVQLNKPPNTEEEVKITLSKLAKLVRSQQVKDFRVIYTIQHARVPIIRLVHNRSEVTCDINFTSPYGYYNSLFIGHVLGYDSRIRDLAVILKLWSKSYKIAEKMVMSNYCLVMLLIFYLQNLEQPMLDTIKDNQNGRTRKIIDGKYNWNFFFNDSINKSSQCQLNLRQLLVGFFEFYHKINFGLYVLCLYNGELIARAEFEDHPDLSLYKEVIAESALPPLKIDNPQTFIVQDGFEQNLNIGIKCKKHADTFFELIKLSHEKCSELKDESFSTLLVKLFTDLKLQENQNETKTEAKAKKKFTMTIHSTAGDLKLCQDIIVSENKDKIISAEDQQKFFFDHVMNGTLRLLQEIYLCLVVKPETQENPMKKEFKVVLSVDTINGRKKMNFKDDSTMLAEVNVSKKMMEKKLRLDLDISLKISSKDKGKTVDIDMVDNEVQKKSALPNFGNFFAVNISPALKFYLKKLWEEKTVEMK